MCIRDRHNPYQGGYYPAGLTLEESNEMMSKNPELFKEKVHESLKRQVAIINKHAERGMYFFDYGNAFLLESSRAGADILLPNGEFKYPSYVQDLSLIHIYYAIVQSLTSRGT